MLLYKILKIFGCVFKTVHTQSQLTMKFIVETYIYLNAALLQLTRAVCSSF